MREIQVTKFREVEERIAIDGREIIMRQIQQPDILLNPPEDIEIIQVPAGVTLKEGGGER